MDRLLSFEYFRAIARTGNISIAADELGISQPALSAFLKRLESQVGTALVDRSTNPLTITDAGNSYLNYLEKINSLNRELSQELGDIDGLKKGNVKIGGAVFFNVTYLPAAVAEFNKLYPGIEIEIIDGKIPEITEEAIAGRIDVFTTPNKSDENIFTYEELLSEKIFFCVPAEWSINDKLPAPGKEGYAILSDADFELLKDCPFIRLHQDQDIGKRMTAVFDKHGFNPANTITAGQTLTSLGLTLAGAGISMITESTLSEYNIAVKPRIYFIDPEICSRKIYIAKPKHKYTSRATLEFIEVLKKHNI